MIKKSSDFSAIIDVKDIEFYFASCTIFSEDDFFRNLNLALAIYTLDLSASYSGFTMDRIRPRVKFNFSEGKRDNFTLFFEHLKPKMKTEKNNYLDDHIEELCKRLTPELNTRIDELVNSPMKD